MGMQKKTRHKGVQKKPVTIYGGAKNPSQFMGVQKRHVVGGCQKTHHNLGDAKKPSHFGFGGWEKHRNLGDVKEPS